MGEIEQEITLYSNKNNGQSWSLQIRSEGEEEFYVEQVSDTGEFLNDVSSHDNRHDALESFYGEVRAVRKSGYSDRRPQRAPLQITNHGIKRGVKIEKVIKRANGWGFEFTIALEGLHGSLTNLRSLVGPEVLLDATSEYLSKPSLAKGQKDEASAVVPKIAPSNRRRAR